MARPVPSTKDFPRNTSNYGVKNGRRREGYTAHYLKKHLPWRNVHGNLAVLDSIMVGIVAGVSSPAEINAVEA